MARVTLPAKPVLELQPKDKPKLSRAIEVIGKGYPGQAGRPLYRLPVTGEAASENLGSIHTPQATPKGGKGSVAKPWC